jgi:putative endonuclease
MERGSKAAERRRQARRSQLGMDLGEAGRRRGRRGEELAAAWLEERGYHIVARNLRKRQAGEVDLLALRRDTSTLHVVEVKAGKGPWECLLQRVHERKLRLLLSTLAQAGWLEGGPERPRRVQVDALLVVLGPDGCSIHHVQDLLPPELAWGGGPDV